MATADRKDPFRSFNFRLEIDGIQRGGFRECTGLDSAQDPVEYREGNEKPLTVRKLPGLVKYANIVLKWGIIVDDTELFTWRTGLTEGKIIKDKLRKNASIILLDDTGQDEIRRWNILFCWPTKWTGPGFNATGNEVAIDTLELAHEGVSLAK